MSVIMPKIKKTPIPTDNFNKECIKCGFAFLAIAVNPKTLKQFNLYFLSDLEYLSSFPIMQW